MKKLIPKCQKPAQPLNKFKPIQEAKQFIENWYSDETTQQVYNNNFNDYKKTKIVGRK